MKMRKMLRFVGRYASINPAILRTKVILFRCVVFAYAGPEQCGDEKPRIVPGQWWLAAERAAVSESQCIHITALAELVSTCGEDRIREIIVTDDAHFGHVSVDGEEPKSCERRI
jgi:hypothetical protein